MLPWFEPACIFLGVVGGTALILVVVYFCIKSDKCFCHVEGSGKTDDDVEYAQVASEDSNTEMSGHTSPIPLKGSVHSQSTPNISVTQKPLSSDEEEQAPGVSTIEEPFGSPPSAKPKHSLKPSKKVGKAQSMENLKLEMGSIHVALNYSKKDLFLFVVIHNISDLKTDKIPSIDQVRVSMVLLPAKKYRSKTKFMPVLDPNFNTSFKFSNVSREDLFQSAMRFRLYGRHVKLGMHIGKEKLLGEVMVHLADVAQKDKVTTSRPFRLPSK